MTADDAQTGSEELQFDRVAGDAAVAGPMSEGTGVACALCSAPIQRYYYHVNGQTACQRCQNAAAKQMAVPRGAGVFAKATVFGIGAAIVGAVVYYAVIALLDLEIGIVAIATGYMVGYAVSKGTAGRGGRRFQVLAALLTYWSVGLAYTPLAFKGANEHESGKPAATADSTRASAADSAQAPAADSTLAASGDGAKQPAPATRSKAPHRSLAFAFGALFAFVFALPVLFIAGTMPSGLISALIILIGMRQAWRMTGAPPLAISGPYRIGTQPSAPA